MSALHQFARKELKNDNGEQRQSVGIRAGDQHTRSKEGFFSADAALRPSFDDPFLRFWTVGCYLAPLAVLELYLRARDSSRPLGKGAVASGLVVLTLLMGVGIFAFGMFSQLIVSGRRCGFRMISVTFSRTRSHWSRSGCERAR